MLNWVSFATCLSQTCFASTGSLKPFEEKKGCKVQVQFVQPSAALLVFDVFDCLVFPRFCCFKLEVHTLVGAGSGGDSGGGMDAVSSSRPQKTAIKV